MHRLMEPPLPWSGARPGAAQAQIVDQDHRDHEQVEGCQNQQPVAVCGCEAADFAGDEGAEDDDGNGMRSAVVLEERERQGDLHQTVSEQQRRRENFRAGGAVLERVHEEAHEHIVRVTVEHMAG